MVIILIKCSVNRYLGSLSGLEGTLGIIQYQLPAMGRVPFHQTRNLVWFSFVLSFGNLCQDPPIMSFSVLFNVLVLLWWMFDEERSHTFTKRSEFKIKGRSLVKEQATQSRTEMEKWFDERRMRAQRNWAGGRGEKERTALDVTFQTGWEMLPFTVISQLCNYQLFQLWKRLIRFYISGGL